MKPGEFRSIVKSFQLVMSKAHQQGCKIVLRIAYGSQIFVFHLLTSK